jgi:hypothetical protein
LFSIVNLWHAVARVAKILPGKSPVSAEPTPQSAIISAFGRFAMNTLQIQDSFEPYFDGRKATLSHVDPRAIEKAKGAKDRIEDARKAKNAALQRDRAA